MKVFYQLDDGGIESFETDCNAYKKPHNLRKLEDLIQDIAEHVNNTDFEAFREGSESVIEIFAPDWDREEHTGTVIVKATVNLSFYPVLSVDLCEPDAPEEDEDPEEEDEDD